MNIISATICVLGVLNAVKSQPTEAPIKPLIEESEKLIKSCNSAIGTFGCSGAQKPMFYPMLACSELMPEMQWPELWPSLGPSMESYERLCLGFEEVSNFIQTKPVYMYVGYRLTT